MKIWVEEGGSTVKETSECNLERAEGADLWGGGCLIKQTRKRMRQRHCGAELREGQWSHVGLVLYTSVRTFPEPNGSH